MGKKWPRGSTAKVMQTLVKLKLEVQSQREIDPRTTVANITGKGH